MGTDADRWRTPALGHLPKTTGQNASFGDEEPQRASAPAMRRFIDDVLQHRAQSNSLAMASVAFPTASKSR
jgi:hypothetical protein